MEIVLKYLINSLENGNILVAFAIIAVAITFKARAIFDFFEKRRESQGKSINEIITNEHLSEDVKSVIQERLNALSFQTATGIYAENPLREKIIKKYNESKGEISMHQIKMAMPHLKLKSGELKVEIDIFDNISFYATNTGALFLILFSLLLILVTATTKIISVSQFLGIYGLAVIFSVFAAIMFKSSLSVIFAKKIKSFIENNQTKIN
jgi:hypothetical protein